MRSIKRIALLCGVSALLSPLAHADNWQVAKDEEGVKVSLSEVAGSKYKAYKGETLIKAPLAKVAAVQEDVAGACAWIHECKSQKLLKHEGDLTWTYTQFNTPVMVTPRDSVLRITTSTGADGSITRKIEEDPAYLPEEKGFVRVTKVEGFWKLVPQGDNTWVTYQVHTEPGGSVPSWLANKFVVDAPFNTLKHLRERVEQR
ncbi:START domain-containing protein [Pseudomonas sp. RP23018S]|uniref:START domain-containing protein n=1 Tax=Pseudomonas sp. RP23018S TaxID=3096037 RepID=UPI002ACA1E06|nr:START domain-containing protein [Pseudomonas sp. RP23018S]MDZ5601881.1 START domain-containing protein [Pseudomonas sp. RP23018S]